MSDIFRKECNPLDESQKNRIAQIKNVAEKLHEISAKTNLKQTVLLCGILNQLLEFK